MITNKDFKEYIVSLIDSDIYNINTETDKEKVKFVLDCFNKEYNYFNNKKRLPQLNKRLADWIGWLPSVFTVDYYNEDIEGVLKEFGFITATSTEEEISNAVTGWFELVAGELLDLAKELNLNTNPLK